jgi:excisionase family DNA binding protein
MTPKTWLTVTEGANYSGVWRDTIYTAVERGELRHVRIGGRRSIRLRTEWIDEWLERHTRDTLSARTSPSTVQQSSAQSRTDRASDSHH